jgi:hypothetical protein
VEMRISRKIFTMMVAFSMNIFMKIIKIKYPGKIRLLSMFAAAKNNLFLTMKKKNS